MKVYSRRKKVDRTLAEDRELHYDLPHCRNLICHNHLLTKETQVQEPDSGIEIDILCSPPDSTYCWRCCDV